MMHYQPPKDLLNNKTILVTGAGSGIGRAVAIALANHGANVVLTGKTVKKLELVYDEIDKTCPGRAIIHPLNLLTATESEYQTLADSLGEQFPALDGLIHNAALLGVRSPIELYPYKDWQELMQVNVNAAFLLTRALLPALQRAAQARIVFTASSVGRMSRAYWGAYSVSKFAVEGLMQLLADELRNTSTIRVNSLNPGATRTDMRRKAYPAEDPGNLPTPESLTPVYLYLMSPDSQAIHGQALDAQTFSPADYQQV